MSRNLPKRVEHNLADTAAKRAFPVTATLVFYLLIAAPVLPLLAGATPSDNSVRAQVYLVDGQARSVQTSAPRRRPTTESEAKPVMAHAATVTSESSGVPPLAQHTASEQRSTTESGARPVMAHAV